MLLHEIHTSSDEQGGLAQVTGSIGSSRLNQFFLNIIENIVGSEKLSITILVRYSDLTAFDREGSQQKSSVGRDRVDVYIFDIIGSKESDYFFEVSSRQTCAFFEEEVQVGIRDLHYLIVSHLFVLIFRRSPALQSSSAALRGN